MAVALSKQIDEDLSHALLYLGADFQWEMKLRGGGGLDETLL
jgi:hypothetical protein